MKKKLVRPIWYLEKLVNGDWVRHSIPEHVSMDADLQYWYDVGLSFRSVHRNGGVYPDAPWYRKAR